MELEFDVDARLGVRLGDGRSDARMLSEAIESGFSGWARTDPEDL